MPHLITHTKRRSKQIEWGGAADEETRNWSIGRGAGKILSNVLVT